MCDLSFEDSDISFCLSCSAYHGNCELPVLTTDPFLKIQSNNYSGLRRDDEEMWGSVDGTEATFGVRLGIPLGIGGCFKYHSCGLTEYQGT